MVVAIDGRVLVDGELREEHHAEHGENYMTGKEASRWPSTHTAKQISLVIGSRS